MRQSRAYRIWIHTAAVLIAMAVLVPIGLLIKASISPATDLQGSDFAWWPSEFTVDRFKRIFGGTDSTGATFRSGVLNSIQVAVMTTAISMVVAVLGGYAFARLRFPFRRGSLFAFLLVYMMPPIALVIPLYLTLARLQMLDTLFALAVTYCAIVTPFCLWMLTNYFRTLPAELEEAAMVDGCGRVGALVRVVLPLAAPGIFTAGMFGFLLAWDEFLFALIFTSTPNSKTIPVAIAEFSGKYSSDFGLIAAGGLLAAVPPVLLALAFQRYVVGGLTSGATKG